MGRRRPRRHSPTEELVALEHPPGTEPLDELLREMEDEDRRRSTPAQVFDAFLCRAGVPGSRVGDEAATVRSLFHTLTACELPLAFPAELSRLDVPGLVLGNTEAAALFALRDPWHSGEFVMVGAGDTEADPADGAPELLPFKIGFEVGRDEVGGDVVRFVLSHSIERGSCRVSVDWPENGCDAVRLGAAVVEALRQHAALWLRPESWAVAALSAVVSESDAVRVRATFVDGTRTYDDDPEEPTCPDPFERVFHARRLALPGRPPDPRLSFLGPVVIAGAAGPRLPLP